jgi:hypothetical protein
MVELTPSETIDRASAMTLVGVILSGIGGIIYGLGVSFVELIYATFGVLTIPLEALGISLGDWVDALFAGPARFLGASYQSAIASIQPGGAFYIGPFTPLLATVSILGVLSLIAWYLAREFTGDTIPGLSTDILGLGADEND